MHRTFFAVLLLAISGTSPSAQIPNPKAAPSKRATRLALVDISRLFRAHPRSMMSAGSWRYMRDIQESRRLNEEIRMLEDALKTKSLTEAQSEDQRRKIADRKKQLDEWTSKRQEETLVDMWKDIQAAIKTYADKNGIDIVLGYGDPLDKDLLDHFPNVNRKMQAMDLGSTVPLFVSPRADITDGVAEVLRKQVRERNE